MRLKPEIINICIRHNCSKIGRDVYAKQFTKKVLRLKKSNDASAKRSNPTLNTETKNVRITERYGPSSKIQNTPLVPDLSINTAQNDKVASNDHKLANGCPKELSVTFNEKSIDGATESCHEKDVRQQEQAKANERHAEASHFNFSTSYDLQKSNKFGATKDGETRVNELNMQMLSKGLYEQLFRNVGVQTEQPMERIEHLKQELNRFGMKIEENVRIPDVDVNLPPLEGKDLEEHFYSIGKTQSEPYVKIVNEIIKDVPRMPEKWIFQKGWTRYSKEGAESVAFPREEGLVFDVEVCMSEGQLPTLATAVSKDAWYSWVSDSLMEGSGVPIESRQLSTEMFVPIESTDEEHGNKLNDFQKKPKIIVGHNVSYDRIRIKEQYWMNCTGTRFVDTMSLHVCVSGINSYQRAMLKSEKLDSDDELWRACTSLNSLAEVHKLYCGQELRKEMRDIFVEGTLSDVREQFQEVMTYCASDVIATHNVLRNLFPLFQERFPHPVTFAGMLELGTAYLPVNSNWKRYLEEAEFTYEDLSYEAKYILARRADEVCKLMHDEKYKEDLWMWDQDWSVQDLKMKKSAGKAKKGNVKEEITETSKKPSDFEVYLTDGEDEEDPLEKQFAYLRDTESLLPAKSPHMPGYPAWYRKLCLKRSDENWAPGPQSISTSKQIAPKLLNLTWENYPLHYIREHGWGFLVPYNDDFEIKTELPLRQLVAQCPLSSSEKRNSDADYAMGALDKEMQTELCKGEFWRYKKKKSNLVEHSYKGSGIWCDVDIDGCCWFFKLPHKDGGSKNVGNPLAKDFLNKFSENVLVGLDASATQVLNIARMVSYWRNNKSRISSQLVVWLNEKDLPDDSDMSSKKNGRMQYGAILPQIVVSGTLTRRAVEPTWMTASNAHAERIGSELRAMVQAPPGYNMVGADVDSQELWIASVIGDAHSATIHGATPFGWMTLIGNKSNGTDMHSVTAKAVGISRDHAKVINYARIYGAGVKFAEKLLKQFNPSMTETEAASKARKMFALTKGKKFHKLRSDYVGLELEDILYSTYDIYKVARAYGKTTKEMFDKGRWVGGSESAMFNRLEEIASSPNPVTPFLNSRLTRALEQHEGDDEKFLPTKVNWVVQSGAVDFLHLMLVSMRWLMKDNARFCLSFHDEIRYLVPAKYKYNAALAMHVTNLLTRSFCASRLGIKDLPMSVAFFASVEVDTVLRKESSHDCRTPSNPYGLANGYDIPPGESLDIMQALKKSGGSLGSWHDGKSD